MVPAFRENVTEAIRQQGEERQGGCRRGAVAELECARRTRDHRHHGLEFHTLT